MGSPSGSCFPPGARFRAGFSPRSASSIARGYLVSLFLFLVAIFLGRRHLTLPAGRPAWLIRPALYSRRLPPKLWLAFAFAVLVGGLLYHPDNYDYLTYRFPRLLHWSWQHQWYWISTCNNRQNISDTGMEWLMAPFFILFQTDRLFFLINLVSYLFFPGLIFSVFRQLGISARVCWWWMWILPAGLCFVLQAGGTGNDMFAVVYLLAALYYLFRARKTNASRNLTLSILAIALLTGTKASNIPLVAVWLAIAWLNRKFLWPSCRPALLLGAGLVGALISFLPVALINIHFAGGYTGDPRNERGLQATNPVAGIVGNSVEIAIDNLSPPLWSHDLIWPVPAALDRHIRRDYPRFSTRVISFQIEETAGIGMGVTAFLALGLLYGLGARLGRPDLRIRPRTGAFLFAAGTALAGLTYLAKMGSEAAPRLVAVYYLVAIAALLALLPLNGIIVHRRLWKLAGYAALVIVFPLVILSPARPLLPPHLIVGGLRSVGVPSSVLDKLEQGYHIRGLRFDNLGELRRQIPEGETAVGFLGGGDDPEVSPWLPFGSRNVIELTPQDTADGLKAANIHYVFVSDDALTLLYHMKVEDLAKNWSMTVIARSNLIFKTHRGFNVWYLLRS